jgi:biofilm PGA synthesis N-glycosyltransferase PgaC
MSKPGITAIVPAYNEAASIADTVRSLLCQTVPVYVIVVDDCSTDSTALIARQAGATVIMVLTPKSDPP